MNRVGAVLLALLLVQSVIILMQELNASDAGGANVSARLADVSNFQIDELHIENGRNEKARLLREGGRWVLPKLGGLPADSRRVEELLQRLTEEDPGWAVAHTLPARQRFQVAPYHFRRKITLMAQNQPIETVYLGNSPSFRKVHARNDEADAIYSVALNLFDLPPSDEAWLERGLLRVKAPLRIIADGYSLDRSSGEWRLDGELTPEPGELNALLGTLKTLQVEGVASREQVAAVTRLEPELILQLEGLGGEQTLSLYRAGDTYFLRSNRHDALFRVSGYTFDQLTGIDSLLLRGGEFKDGED